MTREALEVGPRCAILIGPSTCMLVFPRKGGAALRPHSPLPEEASW
jgi:hypothetical protein